MVKISAIQSSNDPTMLVNRQILGGGFSKNALSIIEIDGQKSLAENLSPILELFRAGKKTMTTTTRAERSQYSILSYEPSEKSVFNAKSIPNLIIIGRLV